MLADHTAALKKDLTRLCDFLSSSVQQSEQVEKELYQKAAKLAAYAPSSLKESGSFAAEAISPVKTETMKFSHRFHHSISSSKNLFSYVKNGVCAGVFLGFDALKYSVGKDMKYLQADGSVAFGHAKLSADAKASLYKDKKFQPHVELKAGAEAALAAVRGALRIGNEYLHADGEVDVGIGAVSGEAKAVISKEEFTLKAEAGAAAVKGEVKGGITIFGITIQAIGTAEIGAVGAGVEFSSKKGEFSIGGKASLLAGLGFKIKVTY